MKFSDETLGYLKKVGWYQGRKLEMKELDLYYNDYPKCAITFLEEFGNLEGFCREQSFTPVINEFSIFPQAVKEMFKSDSSYRYYESLLNKKLYPIGAYITSSYYICCDSDCRTYMIGEYCIFLGNSLYEGIEKLILQKGQTYQLDEDTGNWWNDYAEYVELPPL